MDDAARGLGAGFVLFGVVGFGLTRLCLPDGLRRHEPLWILPIGAFALAFAMTPLGFLGVPFLINLAVVVAAGAGVSVVALRRRGLPERPPRWRALGWPAYLALLLALIALIPLFRSGFATVIGQGSDAHLAAGTAEFLRHSPPLGVEESLPVDQVPLVWRSKQAIYYAFGAVATVAGMETWQVLSALAALLLAMAAVGFFVVAREMLGATVGFAAVAMAIAGLSRMVLHTGMHPYFNQTWGLLMLPYALVLSWWVVRHPSRGGIALLGLFLAVGAFAYPLAVPIPLVVLAVMYALQRRAEGRRVLPDRRAVWRTYRAQRRAVRWTGVGVLLLLVVPLWGVFEKLEGGIRLILNHRYSLELWGGDLVDWFPERQFFAIAVQDGWWIALAVIAGFALYELRRLPRPLAIGLLSVIVIGSLIALEMRFRDYGWYFHFKILAFIGPIVIVLAAVGMSRLRRIGPVLLAVWVMWAASEGRAEVSRTFDQIPQTILDLQGWSADLPRGSSVRLDVQPGTQLWVAYMLADHPLCSQRPLDDTSYPHVPLSRAADYVIVRYLRKPFDAVGEPIRANKEFALYALEPGLPGGDRCSQRMIQTVERIQRG